VLAIARGDEGVTGSLATEVLQAGDVLALAGTREAVAAATALPAAPAADEPPAAPALLPRSAP
jgi:CPA2 family monovalent cation:H+ antiporter-2